MASTPARTLSPIRFTNVTIDDEFWTPRLDAVRTTTIDYVYQKLEDTGRIDNFRVAAGLQDGDFHGRFYNDSDVYKWLEAACYCLAQADDSELRERVAEVVDVIEAAQEPDGYLNTYFQLEAPEHKWTNLNKLHELYCAGHLIEAAVAHTRVTGSNRLLTVAQDFADHIADIFGPARRNGAPGHEEIELALVKLYRETDAQRYLELAQFFIEQRGRDDSRLKWEAEHPDEIFDEPMDYLYDEDGEYDGTYFQDHAPVREQDTVEGHAVRATYLYTAMTDVALETDDAELLAAAERLWQNMTHKRMYVTGGIGSAHYGERFTTDYHLPNDTAYAETCAALGNILWNQRLVQATGAAQYADLIERTLYNGFLAGMSLDGDRFFYVNPLEVTGDDRDPTDVNEERHANQRQEWFGTACCPTNIPRVLAVLSEYIYYLRPDEPVVYLNQYIGSQADLTVAGTDTTIEQQTAYPWDGEVDVTVSPETETAFDVYLRVPPHAELDTVGVNGEAVSPDREGGYRVVSRTWRPDDTITLSFTFPVTPLAAHPNVRADIGRVALQRGPLVYCLESVDNPRPPYQLQLPADPEFETQVEDELLGGIVTITGPATAPVRDDWDGELYQDATTTDHEHLQFKAIPYHLWGHREPGEMQVWVRSVPQ